MLKNNTRRDFLRIAPCAAAASLPLAGTPLIVRASADAGGVIAHEPFEIYTAKSIDDAMHQLQANPGNKMLFQSKTLPFAVTLTTETKKMGQGVRVS